MIVKVTVYGLAQPAGSKQAFVPLDRKTKEPFRRPGGGIVVSVVDANAKSEPWKRDVANQVLRVYGNRPLMSGPLMVTFNFYRPRPQSHVGKRGLTKEGRLHPYPISKPDLLKLARGVEDALTGVVWTDDAIIVRELLSKDWGHPPRVEIRVEDFNPPTEQQQSLIKPTDVPERERKFNPKEHF